jgi:hypothetical protein
VKHWFWKTMLILLFGVGAHALEAEVVFNEPGFYGNTATTVEDKLVDLVDRAAVGSEIHISLFEMTRTPVVKALIRASQRGVDVHLVLDGSNYFDQRKKVGNGIDLLLNGSDETGRLQCQTEPCVRFCTGPLHIKLHGKTFGGSCNGLIINHNKFFLFSRLTDGSENVVVQTSSNLEDLQLHQYQDMAIIRGDRALYDGYLDYWQMQNRDRTHIRPHGDIKGDGPVTARFFPRIIDRDPVMKALRRVSCEPVGSMIRVAEADFNRLNVAASLRDLAKQGCDVKVITRIDPEMFSPAVGIAKRLGPDLMILPFRGNTKEYQATNSIHTKIILIDAALDGSTERRPLVITGSHNLDFFSLHTNDETLLEIEDAAVFDAYLGFWNRLDESARTSGLSLLFGRRRP